MQEYLKVKPSRLKKYGKVVDKTLYLKPGIHCMNRLYVGENELFLKVNNSIKMV